MAFNDSPITQIKKPAKSVQSVIMRQRANKTFTTKTQRHGALLVFSSVLPCLSGSKMFGLFLTNTKFVFFVLFAVLR